MGTFELRTVLVKGIDIDQLTKDQIRVAFILRVPFRFRTGKLWQFRGDWNGPFQIWFRNLFEIPSDTESLEFARSFSGNYEELWTDVIIIMEKPIVGDSDLDALRQRRENPLLGSNNVFGAINVLNQFIIAYETATGTLWALDNPLWTLSYLEFLCNRLRLVVSIMCPEKYSLTENDVLGIFNCEYNAWPEWDLPDELADLSEDSLVAIGGAFGRQTKYIFYEFALLAKNHRCAGDLTSALVMAVVALEGAQTAFVQHIRLDRNKKTKYNNEGKCFLNGQSLKSKYLKPLVCMGESEMPSREVLQACDRGIEMRNEIVHLRLDNSGNYQKSQHSAKELIKVCSAVLKVYECYVRALEG